MGRLHASLWQPGCLQGAETMPAARMDTHYLELRCWEGIFNKEPSSQAIPVITQCAVKFCTNHKMLTNYRPWQNGIIFLMCLHIPVTIKSFYLQCLIVYTNGGEYQHGKHKDTDSFPASWSMSGFTLWILILALLLVNHVSVNKLVSLMFLTYKMIHSNLSMLDYCFANLVCKLLNVLKSAHSVGPSPQRF